MAEQEKKLGVFICKCGGNISDTIDVEQLKTFCEGAKDVRAAHIHEYICSNDGQEMIKNQIKKNKVNKAVIGCCTPKRYEELFGETISLAGLNPYELEVVNLREQCSYVHHDDKEKALAKAKLLMKAGIAKARLHEKLEDKYQPIKKAVAVIGSGIAGIYASLELANQGYKVYLLEKLPFIGGNMARLVKTFPTDDCGMCTLSPKMNEVYKHKNIELITLADIKNAEKVKDGIKIEVVKKARRVDESKCTGCGKCTEKCPIKVDDEFNMGISKRKAIYRYFAQAIPNVAVIDSEKCINCKICDKFCPAGAINHEEKKKKIKLHVGAVIVATGFKEFNPRQVKHYGYGKYKDVITQLQLVRMMDPIGPTGRKVIRLSDEKEPKTIVMIQCVGSRGLQKHDNPYCSRVCCMAAIKHARMIKKDIIKDADIYICNIDIRAFGKGYEEYYVKTREQGIKFIRGLPGEVVKEGDKYIVRVEDSLTDEVIKLKADMVILSAGAVPSDGTAELAKILNISRDDSGFFKEFHPKILPVNTLSKNVFVCGMAQGPKDIPDAIAQAGCAASGVNKLLSAGKVKLNPKIAEIDEELCSGCMTCKRVCEFDAIDIDEKKKTAQVMGVLCEGCGNCAAACPNSAITIKHFTDDQIMAEAEAILS